MAMASVLKRMGRQDVTVHGFRSTFRDWAAEEGIFIEGDRIIFCSVGAGLTFAGGLLVW